MTQQEHEDVRRRMPEAVLLPPEHPLRQALVEHLAVTNGPLEREWLELVREDERMRVELARVRPPPPSLRQRLMEIPVQTQPTLPHERSRWWLVALITAAVFVTVAIVLALIQ